MTILRYPQTQLDRDTGASADGAPRHGVGPLLAGGVLALGIALASGLLLSRVASPAGQSVSACALAAVLMVAYSFAKPGTLHTQTVVFAGLASACTVLTAWYFQWVIPWVSFPADMWIWSESDFVNDIIKVRTGYPLYTAESNNESFDYNPGAQVLTYLLASIVGHGTSVPAYRGIQVLYTALAALVGMLAVHRLIRLAGIGDVHISPWTWGAGVTTFLFLLAVNSITNPFVHLLHNDSLAQLISVTAFCLTVYYAGSRSTTLLVCMAIVPVAGFLVKQSCAIWGPLFTLFLIAFDTQRSWKRILLYTGAWSTMLVLVILLCWLVWGEPYVFWTFTVLGSHPVSIRRGLDHVITAWPFLVVGLASGCALLQGSRLRPLLGPWLTWLVLMAVQIYTSSIAFMMNHIGAASVVAGIWGWVALQAIVPDRTALRLWPLVRAAPAVIPLSRSLVVVIVAVLAFGGVGAIALQFRPFPKDAYRYIGEIEQEFQQQDPSQVLLDAGSWIYLRHGIVMKDRAPCIGEKGPQHLGDFQGIIDRISRKTYSKILVRNLHSGNFWYDFAEWERSSGIRNALERNYREVKTIPAVRLARSSHFVLNDYLVAPVSVMVPREQDSQPQHPLQEAEGRK